MKAVKLWMILLAILASACEIPVGGAVPAGVGSFPRAAEPVLSFDGWQTYQSLRYGFSFQYPPDAALTGAAASKGAVAPGAGDQAKFTINFPALSSTTISAKYLNVTVVEGASSCPGIYTGLKAVKNMGMNDMTFLHENGQYLTGRNLSDWESYSTAKNDICVNLTLTLLAGETDSYATAAEFDDIGETKIFQRILLTFRWIRP